MMSSFSTLSQNKLDIYRIYRKKYPNIRLPHGGVSKELYDSTLHMLLIGFADSPFSISK